MKNFLKTYKSIIILLAAIIIGAIVGIVFKEKAAVLSPFGDIFLNLMFIVIIPLIFLSITTAIYKMNQPKRLGKIMITIIIMFVVTTIVALFIGVLTTYNFKLVNPEDSESIKQTLSSEDTDTSSSFDSKDETILQRTVDAITVNDFSKLMSKSNIIALIVASILFGIAMRMAGEKAEPVSKFLNSAYEIVMQFIKIIMYYAPIGLGCYFAALVGTFGNEIAVGYARTFIWYSVVCVLFYGIMYTIYAFIAGGKLGVVKFWKNIIPVTITSLATCSSAATMPANIETAKKIGVPEDIASTTVSLGTSFHKDGSAIDSVFKIMFLVCLFGTNPGIWQVIIVALLANLLITGVPIGGGTISEMLILTMMGFPVTALPILTIIATITDPPATLLNAVGDTNVSMVITRIVDGKNWIKEDK